MPKKRRRSRTGRQPKAHHQIGPDGVVTATYGDDRGPSERIAHAKRDNGYAVVDTYEKNRLARAVHVRDTVDCMLANGTITAAQAGAARHFQADFHRAHLDTLQAQPLERRIAGLPDDTAQLAARQAVNRAIGTLGGYGAPAANAAWFVLGIGHSVKEWARRERIGNGKSMNEHTARGLVIGCMSVLQALYDKRG